jgi:hypothetical protein
MTARQTSPLAITVLLAIVPACSGTQGSVDANQGVDATVQIDSGGSDSGANDAATSSDSPAPQDVGADSPAMPCPYELGAYTVMLSGAGCGDLVASAPECIHAGATACRVVLASQGTAGSALNGTVDLNANGGFASGAIMEGTVQRTGCTGTWNDAASQLTVDCGGVGSSQSCIATLTRTGACP